MALCVRARVASAVGERTVAWVVMARRRRGSWYRLKRVWETREEMTPAEEEKKREASVLEHEKHFRMKIHP